MIYHLPFGQKEVVLKSVVLNLQLATSLAQNFWLTLNSAFLIPATLMQDFSTETEQIEEIE